MITKITLWGWKLKFWEKPRKGKVRFKSFNQRACIILYITIKQFLKACTRDRCSLHGLGYGFYNDNNLKSSILLLSYANWQIKSCSTDRYTDINVSAPNNYRLLGLILHLCIGLTHGHTLRSCHNGVFELVACLIGHTTITSACSVLNKPFLEQSK